MVVVELEDEPPVLEPVVVVVVVQVLEFLKSMIPVVVVVEMEFFGKLPMPLAFLLLVLE